MYIVMVMDVNGCQMICLVIFDLFFGLGNYVWEDIDYDGQQDDFELLVFGVIVNLKDVDGNIIVIIVIDDNGEYYFFGLDLGMYFVQFVIFDGFDYIFFNQGDDVMDNDIELGMNGMIIIYMFDLGEIDLMVDGGIYVLLNGVISDFCICLNNFIIEDDGQFSEIFMICFYLNEIWIIIDGLGMFFVLNGDFFNVLVLVIFFQLMVEVEFGVYEFVFCLVDEVMYSVVIINGFDIFLIFNVCEYFIVNVDQLLDLEICLVDVLIELGVNFNIFGNMIFIINGEIVMEIDFILLGIGDFILIVILILLDVEECEVNIVIQFIIIDECLVIVGDCVWFDLDCDGIQGGNEFGVFGVEVILIGMVEFNEFNVELIIFIDVNGNFFFQVFFGNYKLIFGIVFGYDVIVFNQGNNDELDSDVNLVMMMMEFFYFDFYEVNNSFDFGFCLECINIIYFGVIGYDQYLCVFGNDLELFVSLVELIGGQGEIEYLWMYINGLLNILIQYWMLIFDFNLLIYDVGLLFYIIYFVCCVCIEECGFYLELNIIVVEVGDEIEVIINGLSLVCWNEFIIFVVEDLEFGLQVIWNFIGGVILLMVNGFEVIVIYFNVGIFEVELIVILDGCLVYVYKIIIIIIFLMICSQNLVIDIEVINFEVG